MKKEEVFELLKTKGRFYCQEKQFIKKFPDIYEDICKIDFPQDFTLIQKMYHYFMNDPGLKLGLCPVCGNRCKFKNLNFGYWEHCSSKCATTDKNVIEKLQKTNIERYGTLCVFQNEDVKNKRQETYIKHYGVDSPMKNPVFAQKHKERMIEIFNSDEYKSKNNERVLKRQNTCLKKYGVKSISEVKEIRKKAENTTFKKYGNVYYGKTEHYHRNYEKYTKIGFETRKRNNTCSTSKIEESIKDYFIQNNIIFKSQYMSEVYPFHCDFYLSDYDLYIEIQGNWTHGFHPFDKENIDDIKTLNIWKEKSKNKPYYKCAIKVWTDSDVKKRDIAKSNNLNYLEIFSIDFDNCMEQILNRIQSGM